MTFLRRLTEPRIHRALLGALLLAAVTGVLGERGALPGAAPGTFHAGAWLIHPAFLGLLALAGLASALRVAEDPAPARTRQALLLSPLVLLLGLMTTRVWGVRVEVPLRVDELSAPQPALGNLALRLEALRVDPRPPSYVLAAYLRPDGQGGFEAEPRLLPAVQGERLSLPGTNLQAQVETLIPHALPNGMLVEDPQAPVNPAFHLLLGLGQPRPLEGYLVARDAQLARFEEPQGRFAVVAWERFDPARLAELRPRPPVQENLVLTVQGRRLTHPATVGTTWELPSFRLKVEALYPDFTATPGPDGLPRFATKSARPRNPWLQVRLTQAGGGSALLMLAAQPPADPSYGQYLRQALPPGVDLAYAREGEDPFDRFVLITAADARRRLVAGGRVTKEAPLVTRSPFVVAPGLSVTVLEVLPHARFEDDWRSHPDPELAARHENPVAQVKVWDPATGRSETRWLAARGPQGPRAGAFLEGRVALKFKRQEPAPAQLHAQIALVDAAGEIALGGPVEAREPYRPSRWSLWSVQAGPETSNDPAAFQVLVVREPGRPLVFLSLGMLGVGLVGALLRPRRA